MKWNWGTKITLSFILFCGLMIFMVIKSFQQDFHLVAEDYYAQELQYQERIDQLKNASKLNYKPELSGSRESITIRFDVDGELNGEIYFYRPDNSTFDKTFELNGTQTIISKNDLVEGRYIAKITWSHDDEKYYFEKEVFIVK